MSSWRGPATAWPAAGKSMGVWVCSTASQRRTPSSGTARPLPGQCPMPFSRAIAEDPSLHQSLNSAQSPHSCIHYSLGGDRCEQPLLHQLCIFLDRYPLGLVSVHAVALFELRTMAQDILCFSYPFAPFAPLTYLCSMLVWTGSRPSLRASLPTRPLTKFSAVVADLGLDRQRRRCR